MWYGAQKEQKCTKNKQIWIIAFMMGEHAQKCLTLRHQKRWI